MPIQRKFVIAIALLFLLTASQLHAADQPNPVDASSFLFNRPHESRQRWNQMDYGPFLTASITMPWPKDAITFKGICVRVGDASHEAGVCFDTDLLRMAAGWTQKPLELMGTPFDGTHRPPEGSRPAIRGPLSFATRPGPGWAKGDDFKDPRSSQWGPLPADWAKYRGLYVHGDQVVLSYTVGDCKILELPGSVVVDDKQAITRTIRIEKSSGPLTLLVAEADGGPANVDAGDKSLAVLGNTAAALVRGPAGAAWEIVDGKRLHLKLPAIAAPAIFKIVLVKTDKADTSAVAGFAKDPVVDPETLTHGGPVRYPQALSTHGELGKDDNAYTVDTVTSPEDNQWKSWLRFGGFDFFSDGRAAISTWNGDVWIVSGIDAKLDKLTWKRYATGLFQPLGLKIVNDVVYALGRDQITRLQDLNKDGEADFYETFNNDVTVTANFHEFCFDLQTDTNGDFFFTKGAPLLGTQEFDPIAANNGCVMKVSKDGSKLEVYATGLRAPNGSSTGPHGEITCSDNEGIWTPSSRINLVKQGGFYGCMGTAHRDPKPTRYDNPLCWLPHNGVPGSHDVIDNSSGGQAWITSDKWGPFTNDLIATSYGTCSLFHVMMERVGDEAQAGFVKFPLSFATGIMRARFNPADGQLYLAGLKGWQTSGGRDGAFQRVRYTGKPVVSIQAMHVKHTGIELTFTQPLETATAADANNYGIEQWNYKWTKEYGSPEFSVKEPNKKGHDTVEIKSITVSPDGKSVMLEIPEIAPVMQMMIKVKLKTADGAPMKLDIFNTINRVP